MIIFELVIDQALSPQGCARPWAAEVAFVGKAPGTYLMMLGGGYYGQRLNKPFKESVTEPEIMEIMKPMIKRYALEREDGEKFGDWTIRAGYIAPTSKLARLSTALTVPDSNLFPHSRIRKGVLRRQCPCMICDGPSKIRGISISFLPIISIFFLGSRLQSCVQFDEGFSVYTKYNVYYK
jgi:hypothetical protein